MRYLLASLLGATLCLTGVARAGAQQQASFTKWRVPDPPLASEALLRPMLPDSVRRKVGYHHWKGAAIGGGVGAALGSALAFGVAGRCADCAVTTWERVQAALLVTGAGSAFGFLVGLASPRYAWEAPLEPPGAR
jgi:hypothetical protein